MALAGRLSGKSLLGLMRPGSTPILHRIGRRLAMSASDMPCYGRYEPAMDLAPIWVRASVLVGTCAACWAPVALMVSPLVH
jgi:hypothetical protein